MKYFKVYTVNSNNKIEFTKEELEKALQKAYEDGYSDGKTSALTISYGKNYWSAAVYDTTTNTTALNSTAATTSTTSINNYDVKGEH